MRLQISIISPTFESKKQYFPFIKVMLSWFVLRESAAHCCQWFMTGCQTKAHSVEIWCYGSVWTQQTWFKEQWEFCLAAAVCYALSCLQVANPKVRVCSFSDQPSAALRPAMLRGCLIEMLSWLCFFRLSSREVHELGGRDPGAGNSALAREHPWWQADRRAHQQHGPVSHTGAAERRFCPQGQVRTLRSFWMSVNTNGARNLGHPLTPQK